MPVVTGKFDFITAWIPGFAGMTDLGRLCPQFLLLKKQNIQEHTYEEVPETIS
jgi:hypothetical protein